VQQLVRDCDAFNSLLEKVRHLESPGLVTVKLRT
jgi:hypothetical protein